MKWLILALLLSASVVPYLNSIDNGFVWDDNYQLPKTSINADVARRIFLEPSWGVLSESEHAGSNGIRTYRPLLLLSFIIDYSIWGQQPFGYHLMNLLLHVLVTLAIFFVGKQVTKRDGVAAAFAVLYATQPLLTDSVSWISGRHDVLLTLMLVTSIGLLLRVHQASRFAMWLAGSVCFFVFALFAKETAVLFPIFCAIILFTAPLKNHRSLRQRAMIGSIFLAIFCVYLLFRATIIAKGNMVGGGQGSLRAIEVAPWAAFQYLSKFFYLPHLTSH